MENSCGLQWKAGSLAGTRTRILKNNIDLIKQFSDRKPSHIVKDHLKNLNPDKLEIELQVPFPPAVKREALLLLWETGRKAGSADSPLTVVQVCVYHSIFDPLVSKLQD